MLYNRKKLELLNNKSLLKVANLAVYVSILGLYSVCDLVFGITPTLGSLSAILFGSFLLALFNEIDYQLSLPELALKPIKIMTNGIDETEIGVMSNEHLSQSVNDPYITDYMESDEAGLSRVA